MFNFSKGRDVNFKCLKVISFSNFLFNLSVETMNTNSSKFPFSAEVKAVSIKSNG